ncbi:MAG: DUF192 domain-containing protein, partial [Dehalococcoidia bacterium]
CGSSGDGSGIIATPSRQSTPSQADLNNAGRIEVQLGSVVIDAEPARTDQERALGLGKRDSLGENEGMLFFLGSERIPSYSMREMRFPLDFVWIAADLTIADLTQNVPDAELANGETLSGIQPQTEVLYVLEVNAGVIAASGVQIGDEVVLTPVSVANEDGNAFANAFANGSFEDGAGPWYSLDTEAWGSPFTLSQGQALDGENSAKLELRSEEGGQAKVFGVVQEVSPTEFPERVSGSYYVERWEKGTPKQYLQVVVIVWEADNVPAELAGRVSNHQMRYIMAGAAEQPTLIANARYVMVSLDEPSVGEWVPFELDVRQDFEQLWGDVPRGYDRIRVLFEVRWDDRQSSDGPSAADVYYDDLYFGPA